MSVSDERQNLVADGADVAIRLGKLDDSGFGARKLVTVDRLLIASPAYLEKRGIPKTPADLAGHDCIFGPGGFGRASWVFRRRQTIVSVDVTGRIHSNSGPGVFAAVLAGLGISMASSVMCRDELQSGALVRLLPNYQLEPGEVHAIFPGGPKPSAKVRAFVDYLASELNLEKRKADA
jgi:DNA-binding transcriptional LysR family regulator